MVPERRSREGAWIEITALSHLKWLIAVAPVRERGLKYRFKLLIATLAYVAPVRERGLKSRQAVVRKTEILSLP